MDEFVELCDRATQSLRQLSSSTDALRRMAVKLDTSQEDESLRKEFNVIQKKAAEQARASRDALRALCSLELSNEKQRLQRDQLRNDLTSRLNAFQQVQRMAKEREKHAVDKAKKAKANRQLIDWSEDGGGSGGHDEAQLGGQLTMHQEEESIRELEERERAIRQIENDIVDVNTIFQEVAVLVHEQGDLVDSIEANVESTLLQVEEGTQQLRKAEIHKLKSRKRKLICSIIAFIFIFIVLAILISDLTS